ncbi:hypothetical protein LPN04_29745 [Rugamonas sp. A1-17]|nr:hypothetical protein [Rugamonas sp. A1-17]
MTYSLRCSDTDGAVFDAPPAPERVTGFRERRQYLLELGWEFSAACVLVIDDVEIERVVEHGRQRWVWEPLFYAGTVQAELLAPGGKRLACYQFDVTPSPGKLGQTVFRQLLDEVLAAGPDLLFGAEAAQAAIGGAGDYSNPHLEFARLKHFGPLLLQSLQQVCAQPLTVLRSDRRRVAPHQVRRFDPHSARSLARTPQLLAAVRGDVSAASAPGQMLFDVPLSSRDLDTPAHRTLLTLVLAVIRRLRAVRTELEQSSSGPANTGFRTPVAARLPYRSKLLGDLEQALQRQSRSGPLAAVRRAEVSAAGLNAIAAHPLYAAAYQRGWQLLRPGIDGPHQGEMLPLSPTWEIYERWCFLCLAGALRDLFPALRWHRRVGDKSDRVSETGTADGIELTIRLQQTFRAMDQNTGSARHYSISGERRPDIAITYTAGDMRRFLVFDPKYSVARTSVLSAMEAAHIYRDCLRWDGRAPDLALLLIPASGGAGWLEDPAFHAQHRVGALPLSPAGGKDQLRRLLQQSLTATNTMSA